MPQIRVPSSTFARRRTRTYDAFDADERIDVIGDLLPPTGCVVATMASTPPNDGWKILDGSWLSKEEYSDLYAVLSGSVNEDPARFQLPDARGRVLVNSGDIARQIGASSVTLTESNLPAHSHGVTDAGHSHTVTDPGHSHTVTDPGHTHTVTDPGHSHTSGEVDAGIGATGGDIDGATAGSSSSEVTGVSVDGAVTGVSVDPGTTGISVGPTATGISIQNTGGGQAFPILPDALTVNWMIRT